MNIANYTIQEWLFNKAHGKFQYDLAESGVQFQYTKAIHINPDWGLDYSVDRGDKTLRELIIDQYQAQKSYLSSIVTHGAQEALYILYNTLLSSGDHVICTTPGWQQAWEVPKKIGCDVTQLEWEPGQSFPIDALESVLKSNTKLLILNSPCNPTGAILTENEWKLIITHCERNGIWIVNDEEYLLDFSQSIVNKYDKSLSISSLSKIYGLPALRLGWAVSPNYEFIEEMVNYKRYTTVSNSYLLEQIACHVLQNRKQHIERYQAYIDTGRPLLDKFADLASDHITLIQPKNTPFAWFNTNGDLNSEALAAKLLNEHQLLVMPAEVFGAQKGIRLTYAREALFLIDCLNMILDALGVEKRL